MYVPPFSVLCTTYQYPIKVLFGENIHFDDNPNKLITATNMIYKHCLRMLYMLKNFDHNHTFNSYILPNYHIERSKSNDEESDKKLPLL